MQSLSIAAYTTVSALGRGRDALLQALQTSSSGLRPNDFGHAHVATYIGRIDGVEELPITGELAPFDCRNNRLAQMALASDDFLRKARRLCERYAPERIAVIIGTSTSGILETEEAYRQRDEAGALPAGYDYAHSHDLYSSAAYLSRVLGVCGPAFVVSTACSSSAKVFADAARLMDCGLCDAAVVGGVDSLCHTTLFGFNSLELVSSQPCKPCDSDRDGISIGEAAGFAIVERGREGAPGIRLLGYGESSDAYHMSSPRPDGAGAADAMRKALRRAELSPEQIDYINLHGTATLSNDAAEANAIAQVFPAATPCSSTKGWTGHTLGAAGITEVIISCLCIETGLIPGSLNTVRLDPSLPIHVPQQNQVGAVQSVLTNSFGFGGNNCSLILGQGR